MKRCSDLRTSCTCFPSLSNIFNDTIGSHALVMFKEEQCIAVVPKEILLNLIRSKVDGCDMKWANRKLYRGKLFYLVRCCFIINVLSHRCICLQCK